MTNDEIKEAHEALMNWGRFVNDDWLNNHILIAPPPTSEGYVAPTNAFDETEPVSMPIDEQDAAISEHVIVAMASEPGGTERYQILVRWYTRLVFHEITQEERYRRLARHIHCSNKSAPDLLKAAQLRFWVCKQTMDGLARRLKRA